MAPASSNRGLPPTVPFIWNEANFAQSAIEQWTVPAGPIDWWVVDGAFGTIDAVQLAVSPGLVDLTARSRRARIRPTPCPAAANNRRFISSSQGVFDTASAIRARQDDSLRWSSHNLNPVLPWVGR